MINKTLIKEWVQDNLSFNKRKYKCIYHKDSEIHYCDIPNFVRRKISKKQAFLKSVSIFSILTLICQKITTLSGSDDNTDEIAAKFNILFWRSL